MDEFLWKESWGELLSTTICPILCVLTFEKDAHSVKVYKTGHFDISCGQVSQSI